MVRIRLCYPKIPGSQNSPIGRCVAFEKYDGTNLHWVWDRELSWYAYGTRRDRFDLDERGQAEFNAAHPGLEEAVEVFHRDLATPLEAVFHENIDYQEDEFTVYTEFFGEHSFAGQHRPNDPKRLVLFDVARPTGMVPPEEFVSRFGRICGARVVYQGKLTGKFIHDVREGKYNVAEGVICKGVAQGEVWMIKVKTNAYMQKLQESFGTRWEDYWE